MTLYRLVISLAALPLALWLGLRRLRGAEPPGALAERLALAPLRPPAPGGAIWLHGASNGELASARALAQALLEARPDLGLLITCNTPAGRAMAAGWGLPRTHVRLAPLDLRWMSRRLIARGRLRALVILENELWPNRIAAAAGAGLPVICVGARMSARSARSWGRLPGLARQVLGRITLLSPQDAASAGRFGALGVPQAAMDAPLQLKALYDAVPGPLPEGLAGAFERSATVLAASSHEGEEAQILGAFALLRARRPGARLILAPRHPRRGDAIAQMLRDGGWEHVRRGPGGALPGAAPVYLADTLGEMALWYGLAGAVFVGGSLVDKGGHTPFEPAAHGCAIVHGPHVSNFAEAYGALDAAGGALQADSPEALAAALDAALDPGRGTAMAHAAREALGTGAGLAPLVARITALLPEGRP